MTFPEDDALMQPSVAGIPNSQNMANMTSTPNGTVATTEPAVDPTVEGTNIIRPQVSGRVSVDSSDMSTMHLVYRNMLSAFAAHDIELDKA